MKIKLPSESAPGFPERDKIRVLLAYSNKLYRNILTGLLSDVPEIEILAETENDKDLIEKYFLLHPDIILTDISMPVLSGFQAMTEIRKRDKTAKFLFFIMHDQYIYQVLKHGGRGFICDNMGKEEFIFALNTISQGNLFFGTQWTDRKLEELIYIFNNNNWPDNSIKSGTLSEREIQILLLIADGLDSCAIAEKLNLSRRTIDNHRAHMIKKLGFKSPAELISYAAIYKFSFL